MHNPFDILGDTLSESCLSISGFHEEFIDIWCDSSLINILTHLFNFGQNSRMKRVLLACKQLKLSCHSLLPASMRSGFLCLLRSKERG